MVNRILGVLARSSDSISVSGSLDVMRYGGMLRNRMLVGVRGAGLAYDGFYYVNSVTHNIKRGEYKQSFQLSRDGLISICAKGCRYEPNRRATEEVLRKVPRHRGKECRS